MATRLRLSHSLHPLDSVIEDCQLTTAILLTIAAHKKVSVQYVIAPLPQIPCVTVITTPRTLKCEALAASSKKEGTAPLLVQCDYRPTVFDGTGAVG